MPIRIRKDNRGKSNNTPKRRLNNQSNSNKSGSSGMAGALLPIAMNLFKKNPKLLLILAVVGGGIYFLGGSKMCSGSNGQEMLSSIFSTGLNMDEEVYDKAEVFEQLADNIKNPMPEKVSLAEYCPKRLNQGQQGSCVGWSSGYAARTILFSKATGENPNNVTFSPSFVYNQIALEGCQGTYLQKAMELMYNKGALPFSKFGYDEYECNSQPSRNQLSEAGNYRTKGFNRLSKDGDNYKVDLLAVKQNLSQGAPVVIGMMVGGTFMTKMRGRGLWTPSKQDYNQKQFGGHAMCVIGYDDYKTNSEGAFQIMNSWGEDWGEKGIFWVRYSDFEFFTKEAYGLYPMGDSEKFSSEKLEAKIGIVLNKSSKYIPLEYKKGITFTNSIPLKVDEDFKIEITNSIECYVYVFGEETDGSSYTLFPYTAKHSPYCGITGTRLFPRDYSLYPDETGKNDQIAIVISKQKLDYKKLNAAFNKNNGRTFEEKVYTTLEDELIENVSLKGDGLIEISCDTKLKNTVAIVLELSK